MCRRPGVLPVMNAGPRGRADRLRAVAAGEAHSLGGHAVEIRRGLVLAAVAGEVVDAEVVGEDEDDVGLVGCLGGV